MILKKLYIDEYKSLKCFSISFEKQIGLFIGINGSGKSTILEALALIFTTAYEQICLGKKVKHSTLIKNSYVIYHIRKEEMLMGGTHSYFDIDYIPVKLFINENGVVNINLVFEEQVSIEIREKYLTKYQKEDLLPNRIILYYSGISKHLKEINSSIDEHILKQFSRNPEHNIGYIEKVHIYSYLFESSDYPLLLAALYSYIYNERIDSLLENHLKIYPNPENFIRICMHPFEYDKVEYQTRMKSIDSELMLIEDNGPDEDLLSIKKEMLERYENQRILNFFGAAGRLGSFLKQLRELSINKNSYNHDRKNYEFILNLDDWKYFADDPKILFENLLMLKYNGILDKINLSLKKDNEQINSNVLSEGEKQLIIIVALNELIGISNTLYLFDEPDNFLHPTLQDDLINNIQRNNEVNQLMQNHYLITTHNPSLINNLNPAAGELFLMQKGKLFEHIFSWYGRDINGIVTEIMGAEFRPEWAIQEIFHIDSLIDSDELELAEEKLKILRIKLSGNDSEVVRLQTKLDFFKD